MSMGPMDPKGFLRAVFGGGDGPPAKGTHTCDITDPENLRLSSQENVTPMFTNVEQTMVAGWVIRKPRWNPGTFFILGCHQGVGHFLGYVVDVNHVPAVLGQFLQKMQGNAHEWENDGV